MRNDLRPPAACSLSPRQPTWNTQVATGIHLAWSLPVPLRATARSFSSCEKRSKFARRQLC